MRIGLLSFRGSVPLVVLGLSGLLWGRALAQDRPKPNFGFSERDSAEVLTNVSQFGTKRDGLKQLEDDLSKSFRNSFAPKNSLQGVLAPQYPSSPMPVVPARRARARSDNQNGWIFPQDLVGGMNPGDPFQMPELGPDGKVKKKNALDQLDENLKRGGLSGMGPGATWDYERPSARLRAGSSDDANGRDDGNLPGAIKDSVQRLKKMLGTDGSSSAPSAPTGGSSFADFFGLGGNGLSPEQVQAHKAYMDQYWTLLNGAPKPGDLPGSLAPADAARGVPGLGVPASAHWTGVGSVQAAISAPAVPSVPPDVNTKVLNQWNSMYAPPQPEPPKPAPLNAGFMDFPKRKFY
jgi:hypothetical protein